MRQKVRTIATVVALAAGITTGTAAMTYAAAPSAPTTCDEATQALIADQAAKKADASAVKRDTAAVKKARVAVRRAAKGSRAKRASAAKQLKQANARLKRAKAKQRADAKTLQRDKESSATLCTPGY